MAVPGRGIVLLREEIHKVALKIREHQDLLSSLKPKGRAAATLSQKIVAQQETPTLKALFEKYAASFIAVSTAKLNLIAPLVAALVAEGGKVHTIPAVCLPIKRGTRQQVGFLKHGTDLVQMVFNPPLKLACVKFNPVTFASSLRIFVVESCADKGYFSVYKALGANPHFDIFPAGPELFFTQDLWVHYPVLTTWESGAAQWGPLGELAQAKDAPKIDMSVFLHVVAGRLAPSKFKQKVVSLKKDDGRDHGFVIVQVPAFARDCMPPMVDTVGYLHPQACTTFELSDTSGLVSSAPVADDEDEDA